jgi:hypothetical protein
VSHVPVEHGQFGDATQRAERCGELDDVVPERAAVPVGFEAVGVMPLR